MDDKVFLSQVFNNESETLKQKRIINKKDVYAKISGEFVEVAKKYKLTFQELEDVLEILKYQAHLHMKQKEI